MQIQRTVQTSASPAAVFAYLSDFTNTTEWDPGTVRTTKRSGDGGVGTIYDNVSKFAGRETELTYEVTEHEPEKRFALRGENKTVIANDTMTFAASNGGTGTTVVYTADFEFKGVVKYVAPLLAPAFKRLGDEAEKGMTEALAKL